MALHRVGNDCVQFTGESSFQELNFEFSKVLVLLTGAPLFCRDHDAAALLDFFLIMCDPSPLIPWPALPW